MSSLDPLDFPPELCDKPSALIGLFGLNSDKNFLHHKICELFKKGQINSTVAFKSFDLSHSFPPVKPKKPSYDLYTPRGLLKRNWMKKRLSEVPAVAVLFYELNWDDPNCEDLKNECVAQLLAVRNSLGNHATKLAVILLQKTAPLPDDTKASERAKLFCASCEIETKQLFVLPQDEHLQGYVTRLKNALYDLAHHYYSHEIKQVKQHRDQLNKTTQQYLFVRHQFKLGFLSELKQDNHNAKKHYELAYAFIREIRINDSNNLEIKLIAGFINYKICYLNFLLNKPQDAFNHLKGHIDFYKSKTGPRELLFEHYSWLCNQYSAFGYIFNEARSRAAAQTPLPSIQYRFTSQMQLPGLYYRLAALYAIERKRTSIELCSHVTVYPSSDPLQGLNSLEFFGQRPWRPGKLSAEPTNPALEVEGIAALKYNENLVNHSEIIINLLRCAISLLKTDKSPRMQLRLMVQMADEYFSSKEYGKALTQLSHILWDYRNEKWFLILSTLLSRALTCAYLSASVQDYVTFSLEILGPTSKFDDNNKRRIFGNLAAVLQMKAPEPEPEIPPGSELNASNLWKNVNSRQGSFTIKMKNMQSCVEAKARFTKNTFSVEEVIIVEIFIRSTCVFPLEFSNISVVVNSKNYSYESAVSSEKYCLKFEPGVTEKLHCEFNCDPSDANKSIHVSYISLTLGSPKGRSVVLEYSISAFNEGSNPEKSNSKFQYFRISSPEMEAFDQIENLGIAKLVPKDSKVKMEVKHDSPALLSEWYPIYVIIENEEDFPLLMPSVDVQLMVNSDDSMEQSSQLCSDLRGSSPSTKLNIPVSDVSESEKRTIPFYLRGHRSGIRNLAIKFWYVTNPELKHKFAVESLVEVPVIKPFDVTPEVFSMKFDHIEECFYRDPFILSSTVHILSPWPILIHNSSLEMGLNVKSCDKELESHLAGVKLNVGEGGTDMFALRIDESNDNLIALGTYVLQWSREGSTEMTSSSVTMPTVKCRQAVIGVEMTLPAHGWVRKPMTVEYRLCNHTAALLELDLVMDTSDGFMFAGQKQVLLRLLPSSVRKLKYNLHPLFSGLVALPKLILRSSCDEYSKQISQVIERNLPSHIYVMPQEKTCPVTIEL